MKTLTSEVLDFLKINEGLRFKGLELAAYIYHNTEYGLNKKKNYHDRTDKTNISDINTEISRWKDVLIRKNVKITTSKPCEYVLYDEKSIYYNARFDYKKYSLIEEEMYQALSSYLKDELQIYSTVIHEVRYSKVLSPRNKWNYPDLVGICKNKISIKTKKSITIKDNISYYSFEVKCNLKNHNLRETFYKTLSNSGWANFTYLVLDKDIDSDMEQELKMLCDLHKVGVIILSVDKEKNYILDKSSIKYQAPRKNINIDFVKLLEQNDDLKLFLKQANQSARKNYNFKNWNFNISVNDFKDNIEA